MKEKCIKIISNFKYCIPFFLALTLEIMFFVLNGTRIDINLLKNSIIFSIILTHIVFYIVFCITNKLSRSTIILSIFIFVLLLVNQMKILYMKEPFMISDFNFASDAGNLLNLILPNIGIAKSIILPFIILIILLAGIVVFTKKNDFTFQTSKERVICLLVLLPMLTVIIFPSNFVKNTIFKIVFKIDEYRDYASYTTNLQYYKEFGLVAGIYGTSQNNDFEIPENYDEDVLNEELNAVEEKNIKNRETIKPNFIVLFSESFFDISKIDEVKFDKNVTFNYNNLKNEGKSIQLLSPSYGGMSENVSYEILTGGKICYFNRGYIPFMQLYKLKNSENMPSILKDLKNSGYYSKILFGLDHYDAEESLKKVGFDEYEDMSDKISMDDFKDELLIDKVIEEFETKESKDPFFYMISTYENHMPYTKEKYSQYDINVVETSLDEYDTDTIQTYSQTLYNVDNQLKRIYDYIKNYDEPTIILFFGDHLPYMYTQIGENLFNKLSYFNTENETENLYRVYNTEALILANFEFNYSNIPNFMSVDLMLPYIINELNIEVSGYYNWIREKSKEIPAYNSYLKVDSNGNKYIFGEENEKLDGIINFKECMQYMLFMKQVK